MTLKKTKQNTERSYRSEPYTLLGSVLVAVNPLRRIADPPGIIGNKKATSVPHPYMIAEVAFQQMVFTESQKAKQKSGDDLGTSNQSVVISGESGSGSFSFSLALAIPTNHTPFTC